MNAEACASLPGMVSVLLLNSQGLTKILEHEKDVVASMMRYCFHPVLVLNNRNNIEKHGETLMESCASTLDQLIRHERQLRHPILLQFFPFFKEAQAKASSMFEDTAIAADFLFVVCLCDGCCCEVCVFPLFACKECNEK